VPPEARICSGHIAYQQTLYLLPVIKCSQWLVHTRIYPV
jgi:hypothetical protein